MSIAFLKIIQKNYIKIKNLAGETIITLFYKKMFWFFKINYYKCKSCKWRRTRIANRSI